MREQVELIMQWAGPQRAQTFGVLAQACFEFQPKRFVETGCYRGIRGDGQSTVILAYLAREFGGKFTSIDIYSGAVACAGAYLTNHGLTAELICDDSIDALRKIDAGVDVLYLDSYDYEEKNPLPCQLHQAIEMAIMISKMSANSLVLLDDCDLPQGGKARLADILLRECGWMRWRPDAQLYQNLYYRGLQGGWV